MSTALVQVPLGIVVSRRKADSQWIDYTWQPSDILVGQTETAPWTRLSDDGNTATFYAGSAVLELFHGEASSYRDNLAGDNSLWVVLRPAPGEFPYELARVTADPTEAEAYAGAGDNIVEILSMPEVLRDLVAEFVAEHYVEQPFVKRKRKPADPEAMAPHRPRNTDDGRMS
ncbi:MAG: DUF3305 domain-containing protein [Pseudorhodoplanes sp.]